MYLKGLEPKIINEWFTLPEAMEASIELYDVTGRLLNTITGSYSKGTNEILLEGVKLQSTGVFYYRLRAGNYIAMKRMIVLE